MSATDDPGTREIRPPGGDVTSSTSTGVSIPDIPGSDGLTYTVRSDPSRPVRTIGHVGRRRGSAQHNEGAIPMNEPTWVLLSEVTVGR